MRISDWSSDVCSSDLSDDRVANARAAIVWPRPLSSGRRHRAGVRRGRLVNLTGTTGALLDAYNRHDVETVASLYTADGTHEAMATHKRQGGEAALTDVPSPFFGWVPDAHWTPL